MERRTIILLLDSSQSGGIETHVYHLAKALQQAGHLICIWFYRQYDEQHPLELRLKSENIDYRYLQGSFSHLLTETDHIKPLILHTHGYKAGILGRLVGKLTDTPVVSTFHNGDPGTGIVRCYTWLDRMTSCYSKNIAVSAEIARRFKQQPQQINNFIEMPSQPAALGKDTAFVGRLSVEKGPDQFLQLAKHQPDMHFRLYGSGPMQGSLLQQRPDNVSFIGQVSCMNAHWQGIGQLCITSRHEGLPMVALEAMAHGIPVFSFGLGAMPQLIKQGINGWIAPLGNIRQMSDDIANWQRLSENDKAQIRKNCRETIQASYSPQAVLPEILGVYQQACDDKSLHFSIILNKKVVKETLSYGD